MSNRIEQRLQRPFSAWLLFAVLCTPSMVLAQVTSTCPATSPACPVATPTCVPTDPGFTSYPPGTAEALEMDAVIVDSSSGSEILRGEDCRATSYPPVICADQCVADSNDSGIIVTEHALRQLQLVPGSQRFEFNSNLLRIKNKTGAADDFSVIFSSDDGPIPFGWRLRFCKQEAATGACQTGTVVELGPEDETVAARTIASAELSSLAVAANSSADFIVELVPSWDTLFNGGLVPLQITVVNATGEEDIVSFQATTVRFDPEAANGNVLSSAICTSITAPPPPPPQFVDSRVTAPFFDNNATTASFIGRPALMLSQSLLTNEAGNTNRRLGDIKFFYADCLLANLCETGEDPDDADSVSLIRNGGRAVGLGWVVSQMTPGTVNPTSATVRSVRRVYYTSNGEPVGGASYAMNDFGLSAADCAVLAGPGFLGVADAPWLGPTVDCSAPVATAGTVPNITVATADRTKRLVAFIRGNNLAGAPYVRDTQRVVTAADRYIDAGTSSEIVLLGNVAAGTEWKLPDLIGSPPLIIGPPKLFPAPVAFAGDVEFDVWAREDAQQQRSIVVYTMDNHGIVHAFLMARYTGTPDSKHFFRGFDANFNDTFVRELWSYVPKGALATLKYTVNSDHHYFGDGLLRAIDIQMKGSSGTGSFISTDFRTVLIGHQGRGGGGIFALDVTDPDDPKVFWDFACEENANVGGVDQDCLDGDELAVQAAPVLGLLDGNWVAIYGSGAPVSDFIDDYRSAESWLTVRDIQTGAVLNQVRVSDKAGNLLTDLTPLRNPRSREIEAMYFGDYYGAQWRVRGERLATTAIASGDDLVEATDLLFRKGNDYSGISVASEAPRPITARTRVAIDEFRNVWAFFGTGDYVFDLDNQFALDGVDQRFYGIRDDGLEANFTADVTGFEDMSDIAATNLTGESWFIEFDGAVTGTSNGTFSERVLNPAVVFGGLACFPTFELPAVADRCNNEGTSRLYCVDFKNGEVDNVATDPRNSAGNTDFTQDSAAPRGSPLVLVPRAGSLGPSRIFQGGSLESEDRTKSVDADSRQACDVLLWRDRG